jgi:hypothetical protein
MHPIPQENTYLVSFVRFFFEWMFHLLVDSMVKAQVQRASKPQAHLQAQKRKIHLPVNQLLSLIPADSPTTRRPFVFQIHLLTSRLCARALMAWCRTAATAHHRILPVSR